MKLVYIAGPYVKPDPILNTQKAVMAAERVYAFYEDYGLVPLVPHLTMTWHLISPHEDPGFWYDYDLLLLSRCDALLRFPGESWGADQEVKFAEANGIPVFYNEDELFKWAAERDEQAAL